MLVYLVYELRELSDRNARTPQLKLKLRVKVFM